LLRGSLTKNIRSRVNPKKTRANKNNMGRYGQKFYYGEIGRKVGQSKRPFLQTPTNNKVSSYKEYKLYYKQKVWYRDKAALLPGANIKFMTAFVQKNKFYKKIYSAYKIFKVYYALSKKGL
jgi:hypothetical protein